MSKNYKTPDIEPVSVNEPAALYMSYSTTSIFSKNAAIINSIPENLMTSFEKMNLLNAGLKKAHLENLKKRAHLDYDKLSQALSVTRATLINKKGEEKYSEYVSERILALTELYSYGYKVFQDEDKFNNWMFTPNQALAGKLPYDIVDNQFGREEIKNIIGRIEYGVYS